MTKTSPGIGQKSFFIPDAVVAPELPPDIDLEQRTSFSHLICVISDHMDLPPDFTDQVDLGRVDPVSIEAGLYFDKREAYEKRLKNVYEGIGFTATDFMAVTLSPSTLATRTYGRTMKANEKRPSEERLDRDEAHDTASRSAGHILEQNTAQLEVLIGVLAQRRLALLRLHRALKAPGRAYFGQTVAVLDDLRKVASDAIHQSIEVAATNLTWDDKTADDLQDALHYNLYGHAKHNNRRIEFWRRYVLMTGKYTKEQIEAVGHSLEITVEELAKYMPYLEATKSKEVSSEEPS